MPFIRAVRICIGSSGQPRAGLANGPCHPLHAPFRAAWREGDWWASRGYDPAFGRKLPTLFERCGLEQIGHQATSEVVRGGSPWTRWYAENLSGTSTTLWSACMSTWPGRSRRWCSGWRQGSLAAARCSWLPSPDRPGQRSGDGRGPAGADLCRGRARRPRSGPVGAGRRR
jgi:hypothetical protein